MHLVRYPGFFRTLGHRLGDGLADIILDRIAPPPPSAFQQVIAAAPALFGLVKLLREESRPSALPSQLSPEEILAAAKGTPSPIPGTPLRADDFPPFKKLGEFTCPKCGGHTWGWTGVNGVDENGTHIRKCSGEIEKRRANEGPSGGHFVTRERCDFTWKATDDAKYFSSVEVGPAPASVAMPAPNDLGMAEKEIDQLATFILSAFPHEPGRGDAKNGETAVEVAVRLLHDYAEDRDRIKSVVGKRVAGDEDIISAAARLLLDADAFIAKQAETIRALTEQVRELILDSEFSAGRGEVGIILTEAEAKAIDDRGNVPHGELVTLVLRDHRWTIRVKHVAEAALKPGDATPPNPTYVHLRVKQDVVAALLFARDQMPQADQTAMAQNAAGGVA